MPAAIKSAILYQATLLLGPDSANSNHFYIPLGKIYVCAYLFHVPLDIHVYVAEEMVLHSVGLLQSERC